MYELKTAAKRLFKLKTRISTKTSSFNIFQKIEKSFKTIGLNQRLKPTKVFFFVYLIWKTVPNWIVSIKNKRQHKNVLFQDFPIEESFKMTFLDPNEKHLRTAFFKRKFNFSPNKSISKMTHKWLLKKMSICFSLVLRQISWESPKFQTILMVLIKITFRI